MLVATNQTVRRAGLIAGIGLLLVAVLAGFANFGVIVGLVDKGDAVKTASNVLASEGLFRVGIVSLIVVAILDVIVAWALSVFFKPVHKGISSLAAWFRVVYAGVFVIAISQLGLALNLLSSAGYLKVFSESQIQAEALLKINSFYYIWDISLIIFGVHLMLLGYLAYKAGYMHRILGVLLVIAGLGYIVDSLGMLLAPGYSVKIAAVTFVGEVALMLWLLIKGRSITSIKK